MAYIVTTPFRMATDGIGMRIVNIPAGELDIDGLGLNESNIAWILRNELADEVGDCLTNPEELAPTEDQTEALEMCALFDDKSELDEWAKSEFDISLKRSKSLENMKIQFAELFEARD